MPDLEQPPKVNRTWENYYLRYDLDLLHRQIFLRVKLYVKEGSEEIHTPKPPLYLARLQTDKPLEVPARKNLEARQFDCCFANPANPTKETHRTVYCPYRGGDGNARGLAKELLATEGVLGVEYKGESQNKDYQDFAL